MTREPALTKRRGAAWRLARKEAHASDEGRQDDGDEPTHREIVVVPHADFVEEEKREREPDEEEKYLALPRTDDEPHGPRHREADANRIEIPAHAQKRFGVVGRRAGTVPERAHEVSEKRQARESYRRDDAELFRSHAIVKRSRKRCGEAVDGDSGACRYDGREKEVLSEKAPIVAAENARHVGPSDESIVKDRMKGHEAEAAEKGELGSSQLAAQPLPSEIECEGHEKENVLHAREEGRAESHARKRTRDRRSLLFHEIEQQKRRGVEELHDDF